MLQYVCCCMTQWHIALHCDILCGALMCCNENNCNIFYCCIPKAKFSILISLDLVLGHIVFFIISFPGYIINTLSLPKSDHFFQTKG